MSDDAGLDKIEARLDMAEKRHDILDDDLRQARDGFADMVQGVHNRVCKLEAAIKHHESGIDEHGNPLPETFADRLRHLERKVFQIESDRNPLRGFDVTCSAAPSQPPTSPPTCPHCRDTKIVGVDAFGKGHSLCPCLKVGDVVGEEAANLLPVGSRIWWEGCEWYLEKTESEWRGVGLACDFLTNMVSNNWTILRIGPAPEATTDHVADASKKVEPDKAEEIAESLLCGLQSLSSPISPESKSTVASFAAMLRVHGVGQPLPLADLIADPRLRPYWDVVKAAQNHAYYGFTTRYILRKVVDALPPELRAAIEAVR